MKNPIDSLFINSIVFSDDPIKVINQKNDNNSSNILFDKILVTLYDFVIEYNNMQFFDDYMAKNIYTIINYIKDNYAYSCIEDKQKVYDLRNKIIRIVNKYLGNNNDNFYLSQIDYRKIFLDCSNKLNEFNIPDTIKQNVHDSLSLDGFFYDILIKDKKNISDKTFDILIMNTMFIYSVNFFRFEYPELLDNNILLKEILLTNKKIIDSLSFKFGFNKKYDKTKCLIKSTKQLLNEIRWS